MFSQNEEEKIIRMVFESPAGNLKPGTILSIGENDGETLSNARALILGGWRAILIEPDSRAFARLEKLYEGDTAVRCFSIGIGDRDEIKTLYSVESHLGKGDTGLLSTFDLGELLRRFPGTSYTEEQKELMTWETFIGHAPGPHIFDAVTIDAEGYDLKILKQMDFTAMQTKLVVVEWNSQDRHLYDQIMYKQNFRLLNVNQENLIYIK